MKLKQGFTLIEVLVVVLIIAILAAIALPQYKIVIEKSRVNAVLPLLQGITTAQKMHFLSYGSYSQDFDELEIELPAGGTRTTSESSDTIVYKTFRCWLRGGTGSGSSAYCSSPVAGISIERYYANGALCVPGSVCWTDQDAESLKSKVCKGLSGKTTPDWAGDSSRHGYCF